MVPHVHGVQISIKFKSRLDRSLTVPLVCEVSNPVIDKLLGKIFISNYLPAGILYGSVNERLLKEMAQRL